MSTKITFYCTQLQYGSFEKITFDAIVPFEIDSTWDANEWMDEQISLIVDEFDLDTIFDWVVIHFAKTDEATSPIKMIHTVRGKIVFEDEMKPLDFKPKSKYFKTPEEFQEMLEFEPKTKPKEYKSVWIDPFGVSYRVGFAGHNQFACEWLEENDPTAAEEYKQSFGKYAYEILEDKGWVRILGWSTPPAFVIPTKVTPKLKNAIRDYCVSEGLPYEFFPEILKSN